MGLDVFSSGSSIGIYRNGFKHCLDRKMKTIKKLPTKKQREAALRQAEKDCKRRR
jgi:hypothetical protein